MSTNGFIEFKPWSSFLMSSPIVIDGKGHVAGRLAGVVAKQLLNGKSIVVLRAEDIVVNGEYRFNHHKYRRFLNKTTNTNPRRGPFHQRAPSEMFLRTVRGMVNYRTARGATAFDRLKVFEGIPPKYVHAPRVVVPAALRVVAINNLRPVTKLGKIGTVYGWKYGDVVARNEEERKESAHKAYLQKIEEEQRRARAIEAANKQLGEAAVRFIETFVE